MSSVIIGNKEIEYNVIHKSKRNVNIRVEPDLTIKVSSPRWVSKSDIEKIIYEKSDWILKNYEKQKQIQIEKEASRFENGNNILFKGKKIKLYYQQHIKDFVFCGEDQIIVFSKKPDDNEYTKNVFSKWIKKEANKEFEEALQKYRNEMNKVYSIPEYTLQIRSMKSRWGTCTPIKKKVTLNLNLMYTPQECMEYVALHELTHFLEIHHNNHFYNVMGEFMPDYKVWQKKLDKEYGKRVLDI